MNKKIKTQWIKALRSGKYKQAQGQLRHGDKFCCLGVLCDLHAKATGGQWHGIEYLNMSGTLPAAVQDWAGLSSNDPDVADHSLSVHNDGTEGVRPKGFRAIATLIEKHL